MSQFFSKQSLVCAHLVMCPTTGWGTREVVSSAHEYLLCVNSSKQNLVFFRISLFTIYKCITKFEQTKKKVDVQCNDCYTIFSKVRKYCAIAHELVCKSLSAVVLRVTRVADLDWDSHTLPNV